MNKKNFKLGMYSFLVTFSISSTIILAHSGKTDEYGGHYDNAIGEYHYHHGEPAHQHPNGYCPYTINGSPKWEELVDSSSSGSAKIEKETKTEKVETEKEETRKDDSFLTKIIKGILTLLAYFCFPFILIGAICLIGNIIEKVKGFFTNGKI